MLQDICNKYGGQVAEMTQSALETMLWSSTHSDYIEEEDRYDEYNLDDRYEIYDVDRDCAMRLAERINEFYMKHRELLVDESFAEEISEDNTLLGQAGHDYWLTVARHGCGFWEPEWGDAGKAMTEWLRKNHPVEPTVCDEDGTVYIDWV